jgi:hypothetical protein
MAQKRKTKVSARKTTTRRPAVKKTAVRRKSSRSIVSKPRFSKKSLSIFGLAFAVVGAFLLFRIFAATLTVHYFGSLTASKPTVAYKLTTGTGTMGVTFSNNTADVTLTVKNSAGTTVGTLKSIGRKDVKLSVPVSSDTYTISLSTTARFTNKKGYSIHISYPSKDVVAPTAIITSPLNNATVKGIVDFSANAQGSSAITKVEFSVDGTLLATDTTSGYSVKWDTTKVANGDHTLSVKSYDSAGRTGQASGVVEVANIIVTPPPPPDNGFDKTLLRPAAGKLVIGAETNDGAYISAKAAAGKDLHVYHTYTKAGSAFQKSIADTPKGSIPFVNFKPGGAMGPSEYKRILNGERDASIKEAAAAVRTYGKKMFVAIMHEPENDDKVSPYVGDADYAKAFAYTINLMRAQGATNLVSVWNVMGFKEWASRWDKLYPGDGVVDWIASDPYSHKCTETLNDFAGGSVKQFYAWGSKKNKPMMWAEWGLDSVCVNNANTFFSKAGIDAAQREMPLLQAMIYWSEWEYDLVNFQSQWRSFANQDEFNWLVPSDVAK